MNQQVNVKKLLPSGFAEVEMQRISACGENCAMCGGCASPKAIVSVSAINSVGAKHGDTVLVQSQTKRIMKAALIVYIVPLVLFFALYFLFDYLGLSGALFGGIGFLLGIGIMWAYNRYIKKTGKITFEITEIISRGDH